MSNNDLEIRLVRLERQTSLLTRLVVSAISIAVAVVAQMLVEQYVGSRFWGLCTLAAMLVFSNWLLYREVRLIEEPFIRMVEQDNAAHAAAPPSEKRSPWHAAEKSRRAVGVPHDGFAHGDSGSRDGCCPMRRYAPASRPQENACVKLNQQP